MLVVLSVWPALCRASVTVKVTRSIPLWSGPCAFAKTRQLNALPRPVTCIIRECPSCPVISCLPRQLEREWALGVRMLRQSLTSGVLSSLLSNLLASGLVTAVLERSSCT